MVFTNPVTNCIYRIYISTHTYVTSPSFKPNTSFHKRNFTEKYRLRVKPHFYHTNTRIFYSYSVNIYHEGSVTKPSDRRNLKFEFKFPKFQVNFSKFQLF